MKSQVIFPLGLGLWLTALALSALGQTTTGNGSHATMTPGQTATVGATTSPADKSTAAPASKTQTRHANAHHKTHTKHKQTAASSGGNQESTYHAALKNCAAGPETHREGCLDDAIARYGRS